MNKLQKAIIACFVGLLMSVSPVMAQEGCSAEEHASCQAAGALEFQANKVCYLPAMHGFVIIDSVDNTIDIRQFNGEGLEIKGNRYQVDVIEHRYDVKDILRPVDLKVVDDKILFVATRSTGAKKDSSYLGVLDMEGNLLATYGMNCHSNAMNYFETPCGKKGFMVAGFNPAGYSIHTFMCVGDYAAMTEVEALSTEYHRPLQSERIQESDPVGVGLTVIAILVVFLALVLVACLISLYSTIIRNSQERKAKKEAQPVKAEVAAAPVAGNKDGEVYAAIAAAIHMYLDEMHDEESNIITIEPTVTSWNSKIYNMNQINPKRK